MQEAIPRSLCKRHVLSGIVAILVHIAPPRYIRSRCTKPFGCFLNAFLSHLIAFWIFPEPNLRAEWVLHLVWAWDKLGFWSVHARHDSLWCPVCHRSLSCDVPALVALSQSCSLVQSLNSLCSTSVARAGHSVGPDCWDDLRPLS